jgi:hypothetical protein
LSTTPVPRTAPAKPISHTVEPHNRPFDVEKLNRKVAERPSEEEQLAARLAGFRRMATEAKQTLARLTAPSAVAHMRELPRELLECYLIVEESAQARPLVLRSFPKPGARARERYMLPSETAVTVGADADGQEN